MATETQTSTGVCPTHGTVEATREMPKAGFPWIVNAARRAIADKRPYRCPTCGAEVTSG
jgi:RNA polymerase subunit RPABC4/transcription elongation factor Spt4